jgi:hypothetical protein
MSQFAWRKKGKLKQTVFTETSQKSNWTLFEYEGVGDHYISLPGENFEKLLKKSRTNFHRGVFMHSAHAILQVCISSVTGQ